MRENSLLIIDAHNFLFSREEFASFYRRDSELCRQKLITEVSRFSAQRRDFPILVFDGSFARRTRFEEDGVLVFFSSESENADMIIEHLVSKYHQDYSIRVVSDDFRVREAATDFLSTSSFFHLLYENKQDFENAWKIYLF